MSVRIGAGSAAYGPAETSTKALKDAIEIALRGLSDPAKVQFVSLYASRGKSLNDKYNRPMPGGDATGDYADFSFWEKTREFVLNRCPHLKMLNLIEATAVGTSPSLCMPPAHRGFSAMAGILPEGATLIPFEIPFSAQGCPVPMSDSLLAEWMRLRDVPSYCRVYLGQKEGQNHCHTVLAQIQKFFPKCTITGAAVGPRKYMDLYVPGIASKNSFSLEQPAAVGYLIHNPSVAAVATPATVIACHGMAPVGKPLRVTSMASEQVVLSLDGQNPFQAVLQVSDLHAASQPVLLGRRDATGEFVPLPMELSSSTGYLTLLHDLCQVGDEIIVARVDPELERHRYSAMFEKRIKPILQQESFSSGIWLTSCETLGHKKDVFAPFEGHPLHAGYFPLQILGGSTYRGSTICTFL